MGFIIFLFIFFVGGGWLIGKAIGNFLFPDNPSDNNRFIDKSVHHHYHDNRSVYVDGETFKNLK